MRYFSVFLLLLLVNATGFSQKAPIKYGKLDDQEISMDSYENAPAVILCDYGNYCFDARAGRVFFYFTRNLRIKILSDEGLKYANQTISFYDLTRATSYANSNGFELRAHTINTDANGNQTKTKIKYKNIGKKQTKTDFVTELSFHFADVKVGSIIEYEISIPTIELVNPPIWFLQYEIPVLRSELRIASPQDIDYAARLYNCDYLDISDKSSEGTVVSYPHGSLSYNANKLQFVKTQIPAYSKSDTTSDESGRMYIKFMLEYASRKYALPGMDELFKAIDPSYKHLDKTEKNSTLKNVGFILYKKPNLKDLAFDLMKEQSFGPPLLINLGMNDTIFKLTRNLQSTVEKANAINTFVSSQMKWDSTYRVFVRSAPPIKVVSFLSKVLPGKVNLNTSLSKPLKKQIGSGSEINFILINLLNAGGIRAYPVLVSTRDKEYIDTAFYNLHQFNHVVAYAEIDGKVYLFDAVKKGGGTILTHDALNPFGLLIKRDEALWIDIRQHNAIK